MAMNDFTETPRAAEGGPRVGPCTHGRPRRKKRALSVSVLMETSNCALGRRLAVRVWTRLQRYSGR